MAWLHTPAGYTASIEERKSDDSPSTIARSDARSDARLDAGWRGFPPRVNDVDGWSSWEGAQPSIRRSADGDTRWLADALHLGGNGLVPQCAAEAWSQLAARLLSRSTS